MFDTALIESGGHHGDHSVVWKLPFAIGLHAAVLSALVVSALISTAEPPDPVIPMTWSDLGGPPPPPQGGPAPIRVVRPPKTADVPTVQIPKNLPVPVLETTRVDVPVAGVDDSRADGPSSESGEPGGEKDGVIGGLPGSKGGGGDNESEEVDRIYQPEVGGVTTPKLIERIDPVYPETARKLRQEGTVLLEAVITSSGLVDDVRIVGSAGPLLDAAAASAVRSWRYRPATLRGRAVAVYLSVKVRFGLNG